MSRAPTKSKTTKAYVVQVTLPADRVLTTRIDRYQVGTAGALALYENGRVTWCFPPNGWLNFQRLDDCK